MEKIARNVSQLRSYLWYPNNHSPGNHSLKTPGKIPINPNLVYWSRPVKGVTRRPKCALVPHSGLLTDYKEPSDLVYTMIYWVFWSMPLFVIMDNFWPSDESKSPRRRARAESFPNRFYLHVLIYLIWNLVFIHLEGGSTTTHQVPGISQVWISLQSGHFFCINGLIN